MSESSEHTLRMERIFDAPQQVVFDYFTVPELMKTWWGPGGTTMEAGEIDLRIGGVFRWHMRTPNGLLTYLYGTIKALDPPKRIAMTHKWQGAEQETLVTLEFIAMGDKTKVLLTQEGIDNILRMLEEGWAEPLKQLAKQLKTRTAK
jgi:uncharacterized protein YndB with AHSA1/START domain